MFCHKCGREIDVCSAFCPYCGTKIPQDISNDTPVDYNRYESSVSEANSLDCTVEDTSEIKERKSVPDAMNSSDEDANMKKTRIDNESKKSSSNIFSKPNSLNLNLGKSAILYFIVVLVVVLLPVCLIKCDAQNDDTSNISSNIIFDSSDQVTTPDSYENGVERWDSENCIYSNFKYGVAFVLPKNMAWHKVSGTAKHTIVKFVQPDTQLTLFVNINSVKGPSKITDIWAVYKEYTNTVLQLVKRMANRNSPEQIQDYNFKRAEFCGKHAIKIRYTSVLGDDRYNEKFRLTTICYTFIHNNSTTIVSVKCYDEMMGLYRSHGISMEDFLKSFQLIPIS